MTQFHQFATTIGGWGYALAVVLAFILAAAIVPRERSTMGHSGSGPALAILMLWPWVSVALMVVWHWLLTGRLA